MAADFCLRLACGAVCALFFLPRGQINPRFYRVQYLTALGVAVAALVFAYQSETARGLWFWLALSASLPLCFMGSFVWSLNDTPAGKSVLVASALTLVLALGLYLVPSPGQWRPLETASAYASALLLGSALTAMLLGHSYLIAPTMSVAPLLRILALLLAAILARGLLGAGELWFWTREHSLANLNEATLLSNEMVLLLPVRWGLGLLMPLVLTLMAWQTTRIRSTQSSTGILYVVVIFCFLGELMGMLLTRTSGAIL
jgi:hypothetical protein